MGRPASRSGELVAISVDGKGAAWCDGVYAGDAGIIKYARLAAEAGISIPIGQEYFTAHTADALGALVSLMSFSPGRAFITEAPDDVLQIIQAATEPSPMEIWGDPARV
jgi:hypothetical protein